VLLVLALLGHLGLALGGVGAAAPVFLTGALACAVWCLPAVALLWHLDRRERETPWLLAGSLLWGAVIATGSAAILNDLFGAGLMLYLVSSGVIDPPALRRQRAGGPAPDGDAVLRALIAALAVPVLVAPVVEESLKGLAVLLIMWLLRAEFDDVRDGIVYGALVGLGFSIAEYGLYLARQSLAMDGRALYLDLLVLRQPFFGVNNHLIWTALTGAGLGLARQTRRAWVRVLAPPAFFLMAVFGHALQNSFGVLIAGVLTTLLGYSPETAGTAAGIGVAWFAAALANVVPQLLPLSFLGFLLVRSSRWEIDVIRQYLRDEVEGAPGVAGAPGASEVTVTPEEYALVEADRPFRTRRLPRPSGAREKAIVNAQNELAFRKWHLDREGLAAAGDPLVAAWRQDIRALRAGAT
jgi:RsiW-degrading membrane proteinase PrsW (M82 family)